MNWYSLIFTASADKSCGVFDVQTGERIKRFKGHTSFVNSCSPARRGPELLASGSDDGSVKVGVRIRSFCDLSEYPMAISERRTQSLLHYALLRYLLRFGIFELRMPLKASILSIRSLQFPSRMLVIWCLQEELTTTLRRGTCARKQHRIC
jgi:WD40 repeat protein